MPRILRKHQRIRREGELRGVCRVVVGEGVELAVGQVVLARDPREIGRPVVKRVARVDLHGGLWLLGDNPEASTDSRTFGAVASEAVLGRVRWRYWPPASLFRVG